MGRAAGSLTIRYMRSPAAFFEDSIFYAPFPQNADQAADMCFCQPVASTISAFVTIRVIDSSLAVGGLGPGA
jgi:hypothetical protein